MKFWRLPTYIETNHTSNSVFTALISGGKGTTVQIKQHLSSKPRRGRLLTSLWGADPQKYCHDK
jgi:hypothetical protein